MEQHLNDVIKQGPVVAVLCIALYWLNQRLTRVEAKADRCEEDRIRLWKRIAHIIPNTDSNDEQV